DIAEEAAMLFLRYQIEHVLDEILTRISGFSLGDGGKRLEISGSYDSYVLTLDNDRLPTELLHSLTEKAQDAVKVKYSNYTRLGKARYPAQMEINRVNRTGMWVFTFSSLKSYSNRI